MTINTPYYLIDEQKLQHNLDIIQFIKENSGAKFVLALKCFSTWSTFSQMRPILDGTTSSSLYEARLGYEEFGKEVHAYSAAFSGADIAQLKTFADKIIFNSISQLQRFANDLDDRNLGLRLNPQLSYSHYDLANPARKYCRLGETELQNIGDVTPLINGVMLHYNCENEDFDNFVTIIDRICDRYESIFTKLDWLSLGGGIAFTGADYPIEKFSQKLKQISDRFGVQIYLEPGEAVVTNTTHLVVEVLDIVHNGVDIAIVNTSMQAHMPDLLIYNDTAQIDHPTGKYRYMIAGKSCLAGDVFATFDFAKPLQIGDKIYIANAGGYTMVENNWFNGLNKPAIVIKRQDGTQDVIKQFNYQDYKSCLS